MFLIIDDISLVIIGIAVMVLLFASLLIAFMLNQRKRLQYQETIQVLRETQQNQLIEAAVRSEEIERHRIAETLHDEVGAILSSSKLHLQGIKTSVLNEHDKKLYDKCEELLDEGIQIVRGVSHNLHSNILKEFGLNEALRHFINKITQGSIIKASTSLDNNYTTLSSEKDISIYRMVQELINNILKHAHAEEIMISSSCTNDYLNITISHNGIGLTQQQFQELRYKKEGLGLKNIQNRVILLKGAIHFSSDARGYNIVMYVPINKTIV